MTPRFDALLFDFDGVLIESEAMGNRHIADYLTAAGHPTTAEESMANFMGLAGKDFLAAVEAHIGRPIPEDFHAARMIENERCLAEGIAEVAGATAFILTLPPTLRRAVVSSSRVRWIATHLDHLGLRDAFGPHLYSGAEHVANGKPAPDLYLLAAEKLGVSIERCAIIEDSPVGATGAVASGGYVIGLTAGGHCGATHGDRLRAIGVDAIAHDFTQVAALLS
ncbi:haloacid dehalogenase [Sphingomonas sp. Leaf231]|uniref:HAD family hydrolase n=1 Tax=Sphingomonas sp. Leaf231 TaxID=1736301 RepID=UPI0006F72F08|nr:HAD family phosphatase [Sphingomonas sp. Leaf231]KQN92458.1 haloacid dehalogenase [Sphingomonas sp. Leaf231]